MDVLSGVGSAIKSRKRSLWKDIVPLFLTGLRRLLFGAVAGELERPDALLTAVPNRGRAFDTIAGDCS